MECGIRNSKGAQGDPPLPTANSSHMQLLKTNLRQAMNALQCILHTQLKVLGAEPRVAEGDPPLPNASSNANHLECLCLKLIHEKTNMNI